MFAKIKQFFAQQKARELAKSLKAIKNPKAIREDRVAAIEYIASLDDANEAVPILLARFDYSLEHGINDSREKEACMEGILKHGVTAIPLVETHLRETSKIAWPIKVLGRLANADELAICLEQCLDYNNNIDFDQEMVDKNYDILCYLLDYDLSVQVCSKIVHFLGAHDERVRYAAVEVLLKNGSPEIVKHVERFIVDESSENIRLRQAVIEAFLEHHWTLQNKHLVAEGLLLPGIMVTKGYQLVTNR